MTDRYTQYARELTESAGKIVSTHEHRGKVAKVYKQDGEFLVKFWKDGEYLKDADYETNDKADAQGTAKHFISK